MIKKISQENKMEIANIDQKDRNICDINITSGERFELKGNQVMLSAINNNNNEINKIVKQIICV